MKQVPGNANALVNYCNGFVNEVKGARIQKNTPAFAVSESRRGHYFELEEKVYFLLIFYYSYFR